MGFRFGKKKKETMHKKEIIHGEVSLDLAIDLGNLNDEIMNQPLLYKKYTELDAEAQKAVRMADLRLSQIKASAHIRYSGSNNKLKVKDLEALVDVDRTVVAARTELISLQEQAEKIRGALKAAYQRHDSLKDLAANRRKELID